jgi:hypothetical protein
VSPQAQACAAALKAMLANHTQVNRLPYESVCALLIHLLAHLGCQLRREGVDVGDYPPRCGQWLKRLLRDRRETPGFDWPNDDLWDEPAAGALEEASFELYAALCQVLNETGEAHALALVDGITVVLGLTADVLSVPLHRWDFDHAQLEEVIDETLVDCLARYLASH